MHNHNEKFYQVGLLDQALISLGLALSPPSTSVSSDFMVLVSVKKIILTSIWYKLGWVVANEYDIFVGGVAQW